MSKAICLALVIPQILYHGTALRRLKSIQEYGLRGDMPRHDPVDYVTFHHVYLTDTFEKARFYSLYTSALDNHVNKRADKEEPMGVVFYISTKGLKNIERDPEEGKINRQRWPKERWYRCKGGIPRANILKTTTHTDPPGKRAFWKQAANATISRISPDLFAPSTIERAYDYCSEKIATEIPAGQLVGPDSIEILKHFDERLAELVSKRRQVN